MPYQNSSPPNLLLTKTLLPIPRSKQVQRDRLIKLLATFNYRPVTLITAPAGYGKTTLLSQWLASNNEAEQRVAWVSLDEFDNESARFWGYICEGFSRISSSIEKALIGVRKRDVTPVDCPLISTLINEVSRLKFPVVLVLDDYHSIHNTKIHQAVEFFIHHQPPNLRVVISSRVEPPFSIARLRASEKVMDIHIADLQFNLEETNIYLNHIMNLGLKTDDIEQISTLTWGWIAGLQLAAVSIKDQPDIEDFLTGLRTGNRYILDFLFEEVFNRQEENVKKFLLSTSILDRLNPSLCDAVSGDSNSKIMLEYLNRANLFVSVLDESKEWFHYHPLFSNLLQRELSRRGSEIIPELHRRASIWYGEHGLIERAINHSLVIGDYEQIERLFQKDFFLVTNLLIWGDYILLTDWLEKLPREVIEEKPSIIILTLWRYMFQSRFDEMKLVLPKVQEMLSSQNNSMDIIDKRSLDTQLKTIQACTLQLEGDYLGSIELAQQTLEKVSQNSFFYRSFLFWTLAEAHERLGDINQAYNLFSEAITLSDLAGGTLLSPFCTYEIGRIQILFGKLNQARQLYEKGLNSYGNINKTDWHPIPAGLLYVGLGRLYIEWNQLELAELVITRGISLIGSQSPIDWILDAQIALATLKQARGDFDGSIEILSRASNIANMNVIPREVGTLIYIEICNLNLVMGTIDGAKYYEKILEEKIQVQDIYYSIILQIIQVRICLSEKKLDGLLANLELLLSRALDKGYQSLALEIMILKAIYWKMIGETSLADDQVMRVLSFTQPQGYIYSIIKENGINDLLEDVYQHLNLQHNKPDPADAFGNYIQEILDSSRKRIKPPATSPEFIFDSSESPIERLSDREIEILRLAAKGVERNEISRKLYISNNTVKTHLRIIYRKVGAHNLPEAIKLAYRYKLL